MERLKVLANYDKRVNILGSYYLLTKVANDRQKYKEFDNIEFFNLMFQTLCCIYDKSIRREYCFVDDIEKFIEALDSVIYKKNLSIEQLKGLTSYLIKGLTNNGKVLTYPFHSIESNKTLHKNIQIIEAEVVVVAGNDKLSYKLTNEGYHLLLSTKEYDELFNIRISQTLAKIRLTMDDYEGAKNEVYDIVNSLEIQRQKIDTFIKMLRLDVYHIKNQNYVEVVDETLKTLVEEMDKYDELKQEALLKLQDKENFLEDNDGSASDKDTEVRGSLIKLNEFILGINAAKDAASRLITRIQQFEKEHEQILEQLLRAPVLKKFNFKEEILDRLENDVNAIEGLKKLYVPLFDCRVNNLFSLNVPYQEQKILGRETESKVIISNEEDYIAIKDEETEKKIELYETIYYAFFKKLMHFAKKHISFTMKDFLHHCMKEDRDVYLLITENAYIFRNIVMYFALSKPLIEPKNVLKMLKSVSFSPDFEFQIERMFEQLQVEDESLARMFDYIEIKQLHGDEFKVNVEIDIENLTAKSMDIMNIQFKFGV